MKKVVLAYSGGLDTTCSIKWLNEQGFKVICFSANLGSEFSPSDLRRRAMRSGAEKIYIKDLRKEFAYQYILPALKANACYEGKYLLSTALGRPLIAKHLVEIAKNEKAEFVAHGCSGKGNDQVRFETVVSILSPKLKVIAPLREWDLKSREEEVEYALRHKLPIRGISEKRPYSIDKNIWGVSLEAEALEDLGKEPPPDSYFLVLPLKKVEDKEFYLEIEFEKGKPVRLNGKKRELVRLIEELNEIGAKAGVGRTDLIEDRVVGIKSREIYEAPAAWILYFAHKELESLTLDRNTLIVKEMLANKYAELVYQGLWYTSLRRAIDAFVEETQKVVSGIVKIKIYKGNIIIASREAKYSLYKEKLATYGKNDEFDRGLAKGFIKLWAMPYLPPDRNLIVKNKDLNLNS